MNLKIGNIIKELRLEKYLTQEDIAKILNIKRSTYKDYELQISLIPIKHLVTLSEYYNVSIDYMFNFTGIRNYNVNNKINKIKAGERLKEFRCNNKLTQVKLASILNTSFSNIAFYEKGRNLISTPFLYQLCNKYKISADYLLGKTDSPKYLN